MQFGWGTSENEAKPARAGKPVNPLVAVVVIAIAAGAFYSILNAAAIGGGLNAPGGASGPAAPAPVTPATKPIASQVNSAALLEELRADGDTQVSDVKITDNGSGSLTVDVYTNYYPKADNVEGAKGLAFLAASTGAVSEAYPRVSVKVRIWPQSKSFYMVRVSGDWTNGHLDAPYEVWVSDAVN